MQKINSETGFRAAILQLESKQADEGTMLKEQFHLAYESIKPINLVKRTFVAAAASQYLRDNVLNTVVGLTAGYISKILFVGLSNSPLKKLLGTALMFGITNVVAKNPEAVKSLGKGFLKIIISKWSDRVYGVGDKVTRYRLQELK